MRFSRHWLSDYVELPASADELARRLTACGHAVEQIETVGDDVVFDVDVTTNRPDVMCHFGMAREIAALLERPLREPVSELVESARPAAPEVAISIAEPALCPRYVGRVIRGVVVAESPDWLVRRLEAIGLRSINNVVDVTNYVLWELGQPLHAFDLSTLEGPAIEVRLARSGERLQTLDGVDRTLDPEMLVIADGARVVALAGVMGGLATEVTAATRDVLLEAAFFAAGAVRTTSGRLALKTDASHRFERGVDPELAARAAARAAALIAQVAGGEVLAGSIDVHPAPVPRRRIPLSHQRLVGFVGTPVSPAQVENWLGRLGFGLEPAGPDEAGSSRWQVEVPPWRWHDVHMPADLYEEVVRLLGFDAIPPTLPRLAGPDGVALPGHRFASRLRAHLAACGYSEAITYAFHDADSDRRLPGLFAALAPRELANPLSERYAVMRRSLLPNLLESARFNQRRGVPAVRMFEIGHVFAQGAEEIEALALVAGGVVGTPWDGGRELDFFDLKGVLESFAPLLAECLDLVPGVRAELSPGCSARIVAGEREVGYCGLLVDPETSWPLYVAELATGALSPRAIATVVAPSRFPGIALDLTFTHALAVPWAEVAAAVGELATADLASFGLKDRYRGQGVPAGAVNTTLHFLYVAADRSLTLEEVNERHQVIRETLETRFGWREERTA